MVREHLGTDLEMFSQSKNGLNRCLGRKLRPCLLPPNEGRSESVQYHHPMNIGSPLFYVQTIEREKKSSSERLACWCGSLIRERRNWSSGGMRSIIINNALDGNRYGNFKSARRRVMMEKIYVSVNPGCWGLDDSGLSQQFTSVPSLWEKRRIGDGQTYNLTSCLCDLADFSACCKQCCRDIQTTPDLSLDFTPTSLKHPETPHHGRKRKQNDVARPLKRLTLTRQVKPFQVTSQSKTQAQPASFLTLPCELRQKILLLSLHESCKADIKFNILLQRLSRCLNHNPHSPIWAPNITNTALALRMASTSIREHLPYVIEKCLVRLEESTACSKDRPIKYLHFMALLYDGRGLSPKHVPNVWDGDARRERIREMIGMEAWSYTTG